MKKPPVRTYPYKGLFRGDIYILSKHLLKVNSFIHSSLDNLLFIAILLFLNQHKRGGEMTKKQDELKVYCFYWTNTRLGIKSADGIIHYDIEKRMVIAINEKEAREALDNKDEKLKKSMREQMKGTRPDREIEELIENVFYKDGLQVREFLIKKDLVI